MASIPQIKRLLVSRYQQFGYLDLDFTDPKSGEPLSRICLLGPNGVGKSTLLDLLYRGLDPRAGAGNEAGSEDTLVLTGFVFDGKAVYLASNGAAENAKRETAWFTGEIEGSSKWASLEHNPPGLDEFRERFARYQWNDSDSAHLAGTALAYFSPEHSLVDKKPAPDFGAFVQSRQQERQSDYHQFLKRPENRERTIASVDADFETSFPNLLDAIHELWRPLLDEAFLELRLDAGEPLTSTQTGDEIAFTSLSRGLQDYLLRQALVFAQYFRDPARSGFLFLDDPETGINPELARQQMLFFQDLIGDRDGQLIATTHSPRIAALFRPEERFLLRFDEETGVAAVPSRSSGPVSESDLSSSHSSTTGRQDNPSSRRKLSLLKRAIEETDDQDELADLLDEMVRLRNL